MKKRTRIGLTLLEAIISMWILSLTLFSVIVCIHKIPTSQKKIIALSLARQEIDRLKFLIASGDLVFTDSDYNFPSNNKVKIYSKFIVLRDGLKKEINPKNIYSGGDSLLYYFEKSQGEIQKYLFAELDKTADSGDPFRLFILNALGSGSGAGRNLTEDDVIVKKMPASISSDWVPGLFLNHSTRDFRALMEDNNIPDAVVVGGDKHGQYPLSSYILDVVVDFDDDHHSDKKLTVFAIDCKVSVGWFERGRQNELLLRTQDFSALISSTVRPFYKAD